MNLQEIKALIDAMAASDLSEMALTRDDVTLRLSRRQGAGAAPVPGAMDLAAVQAVAPATPLPAQATPTAPTEVAAPKQITAPLFGLLHWCPAPDAAPFVSAGQPIVAGQVVCVIEAMKVFNEVRAEYAGTVLALLAESGEEVEAGQPLLRLG